MAPQAFADPFSGLAKGLMMGQSMEAQAQNMMMQKAESKMKEDLTSMDSAFKMLNIKGLPDQKKVEIYNQALVPISNRLNPKSGLTEITEWPTHGNDFAKRLASLSGEYSQGKIGGKDYLDSLNLIAAEASAGGRQLDIKGLTETAQRGRRTEQLGLLPAGAAGPETALAADLTSRQEATYIEKGTIPTKDRPKGTNGKGGSGGDKRSKDAFAYMKTVLQKPDEFGMVQELDAETVRKATMHIDALMKQYPNASPQRLGELAIRQGDLSGMARQGAESGISREPSATMGKQIDRATAQEFLRQAGGDKAKARQLANEAGYTF